MTTAPDTETEQPDAQLRERTFSWDDPVAIARAGAGLSGAEFFAAIGEGKIPPPPVMRALDFDGISFGEGRAVFRLTPREFHYNPLGTVHGGVFATLLDSACGCAVHTTLPVGVFYTSLDLSVKFLRPVTVDTGPITAEGTVVHLGRRTALAEARITDAAGKVYVTATSSCLLLRPEPPGHRVPDLPDRHAATAVKRPASAARDWVPVGCHLRNASDQHSPACYVVPDAMVGVAVSADGEGD